MSSQTRTKATDDRIAAFIRQEVQNQGFVLGTEDGKRRVSWMRMAWHYAEGRRDLPITLADIREIGCTVEPEANRDGFRIVGVQVGGRVCAPSFMVVPLLQSLLRTVGNLPPIEIYKQFQLIHPFVDGNGRTGKVLLHWLNGKLDDPEMPPDLFGGGVP